MQSVAIGQIGRACGDGVTRRILVIGTAAVIFTPLWARTNMAQSARSELEEIVRLVGDPDGYIDAELHARFFAAAGGGTEVTRYAASFGDLDLHKAHSAALWHSAELSLANQRVTRTPELDAVESAIRASESKGGRTRLSTYVEETPKALSTAARGSWTTLDGRQHVFQYINIAEMRGSVDARAYRLAALFQPAFAPPTRRWVAPRCPVGFDCDIAISYLIEENSNRPSWSYRAQITKSAYFAASVFATRWIDSDVSIMRESIKLDILSSKGQLVGAPDFTPFRGTPSVRYEFEGESRPHFGASRLWLLPERSIKTYVSIVSTASASDAKLWLNRIEPALVLV
jgi:hypothetical protein